MSAVFSGRERSRELRALITSLLLNMTLLVCVLLTAGLASAQESTTALTTEMTVTELSSDFETTVTTQTGGNISLSKPSSNIVEPAPPCDRDWSTRDFLLEHPGFPLEYPNGVLCRYSVRRHSPSVCGLEITFRKFELESSPGCEADFFAVGDERLCGRIPAHSVVQSAFDEDSDAIAMTFGTDASGTRSGFQIFFRQTAHCEDDLNSISAVHACDVLITDISGELVTRRSPSDSLGDPVCRYTVGRRHSGYCQLELDFVDLEVDYSPGCVHSYVELDGHRFCGTSLRGHKKNVTFDTMGNVHIVYKTDTVRMDRGFHLLFRQLPCPAESPVRSPGGTELVNERLPASGCSRVYSEQEFYLESPGFPNYYPNGLDCRLVVRRFRPSVCRLDIRFLDFDVEESPGCVYDFLQLDSQRLCGVIPEDNVKTTPFLSFEKVLRFKTDSVNPRPGFFLFVRQLDCGLPPASACDLHLWDREARVASPNYPRDYDNNLRCRYTVHREGEHICRLEVTFLDLEVQDGSPGCYHDFLEMDGGFRACGNAFQGSTRSLEFVGPEQVLFFSSDAWSTARGFLLALRQVPCAEAAAAAAPDNCDRRLEAPSFLLRSPLHPLGYPPNLACRYLIRKASPSVCQLRFRFAHFDLESSPGCSRDYLALDGQRLCGSLLPNTTRTFRFDGPEQVVLFRSDAAVQASGFEAAVDQVECGATPAPVAPAGGAYCSRHLTELRSSVSSPNYPSPYPPTTACRYTFRLQPGHCALEIHFADFALEHSLPCARDYLELAGQRYCGQQLRGLSKVEPGPEVVMTFVSDGLVSDKGFLASFRQVPCGEARGSPSESSSAPCGGHLSGPSFDVRWPELSPDYGQSASCEWTVHRLGADTCALRITFAELELGEARDCARHFVQVDGHTLCGRLPPYTVREYSFSGPLLLIRASSAQLPRPRVLLRAQQVPCGAAASCDRTLAGAEFEVSSWGPSAGALDCRYVVRKASPLACRLELVLERFELPGGCLDAHLRVDADDRLCGSLAPYSVRLYDFGSSEKLIHFRATRLPPGAGFLVRGRQLPCGPPAPIADAPAASSSRRCDQSFGVEEFSLRSPGHPTPYPPDLLCRFVVIRAGPHVCGLQLAFEAFDLEDSYQCRRDYLEVDGERLCGPLPPGSVRDYAFHPADRTKVLTFRSDYANGRQGFALRVRQTRVCPSTVPSLLPGGRESACGSQYLSSPRGSLSSPGFPGGYPAGQCLVTFLQLRGFCSVRLRFRDFDLAPAADCLADHLELEPGRRYCDGQLFQATRELFFPWSNSSTLSVLFHSERGSAAHRGYSADFEQVPCRRQARELDAPPQGPTAPSSQADRDEDWDDSRTTPKNSTVEYAP